MPLIKREGVTLTPINCQSSTFRQKNFLCELFDYRNFRRDIGILISVNEIATALLGFYEAEAKANQF